MILGLLLCLALLLGALFAMLVDRGGRRVPCLVLAHGRRHASQGHYGSCGVSGLWLPPPTAPLPIAYRPVRLMAGTLFTIAAAARAAAVLHNNGCGCPAVRTFRVARGAMP